MKTTPLCSYLVRPVLQVIVATSIFLPCFSTADTLVEIYTTPDLKQCWIGPEPGELTVYVVHRADNTVVDGVRFRLVADPELDATYIGETLASPGPPVIGAVGNTQDGIQIQTAYYDLVVKLVEVHYIVSSIPEACAKIRFAGHPVSLVDDFQYHDFSDGEWKTPSISRPVYVAGAECPAFCLLGTTPVEHSTWGSVKALYR